MKPERLASDRQEHSYSARPELTKINRSERVGIELAGSSLRIYAAIILTDDSPGVFSLTGNPHFSIRIKDESHF